MMASQSWKTQRYSAGRWCARSDTATDTFRKTCFHRSRNLLPPHNAPKLRIAHKINIHITHAPNKREIGHPQTCSQDLLPFASPPVWGLDTQDASHRSLMLHSRSSVLYSKNTEWRSKFHCGITPFASYCMPVMAHPWYFFRLFAPTTTVTHKKHDVASKRRLSKPLFQMAAPSWVLKACNGFYKTLAIPTAWANKKSKVSSKKLAIRPLWFRQNTCHGLFFKRMKREIMCGVYAILWTKRRNWMKKHDLRTQVGKGKLRKDGWEAIRQQMELQ